MRGMCACVYVCVYVYLMRGMCACLYMMRLNVRHIYTILSACMLMYAALECKKYYSMP